MQKISKNAVGINCRRISTPVIFRYKLFYIFCYCFAYFFQITNPLAKFMIANHEYYEKLIMKLWGTF